MQKQIRKAVIPVAGMGTRFLPATKALPKEMLTVVDKPVIQYIVEELVASGIEQIILVTGYYKRAIEDHFDRSFELEYRLKEKGKEEALSEIRRLSSLAKFIFVRQPEPLGPGHAVLMAKEVVNHEPFIVVFGDEIVDADPTRTAQMLSIYREYGKSVLSVRQVERQEISKYGVVAGKQISPDLMRVERLVEKPTPEEAPSDYAIFAHYILDPKIFDILEATAAGAGGEIQITDALNTLAKEDELYAYAFSGELYDTGTKLGFLKATVAYALKNNDEEVGTAFREYLKKLDL
ncbi:MAG: UTP--glucose-1-phosphate uridylyltransferase GalU [Parcubacteria group bacterium]|nr:UTP--glucose-1-phosphate uridylyltransferase GalU [Parcubacteria group bacterium]